MQTTHGGAPAELSFCRSVEALLRQVTCRRIVDEDGLADVYRLRYRCYLREGAIERNAAQSFSDRFDDLPNTWVLGFFIEGRLAASLRIGVATAGFRDVPAMTAFADILDPLLDEGQVIVDPTRFVIDHDDARLHPKLAYVTSRASWLASEHFRADCTVSTVRGEHQAFYRRFHGQRVLCGERHYPSLKKPLSLMMGRLDESRPLLRRYPFLCSTRAEREALFGGLPVAATPAGRGSLAAMRASMGASMGATMNAAMGVASSTLM